jgi:hypothetical protein
MTDLAAKLDATATAECERFLRESGFYETLEREAEEARIGCAVRSAEYRLTRIERIPLHRLIIIKASRPAFQEPRPVPTIRRALVRAFRAEGFRLRADLLSVRFAGRNVLVSAGILEP